MKTLQLMGKVSAADTAMGKNKPIELDLTKYNVAK